MDKFNDNLEQFVSVIKKNYPLQVNAIDNYYSFDNPGTKYLDIFLKTSTTIGDDISTKNEIIFSKDSIVLPCIDFNTIWKKWKRFPL